MYVHIKPYAAILHYSLLTSKPASIVGQAFQRHVAFQVKSNNNT